MPLAIFIFQTKREKIMLAKEKIDRINELARLSRERELSEEELAEQKSLREEYLAWFRASIRGEKTDSTKNEGEN